ncbi:MAG: hypothetical protein K5752_01025 [Succinivibrionaceae bacterium]|nr:hypothetical protein [Succinivibrionaceae bacterium]
MFRKCAILSRKRTDESGNKGIAGSAVGSAGLETVLHILILVHVDSAPRIVPHT